MRSLLASILLSCAISACTGSGQVTYSGEATTQPDLVEIEPGVQVIADYNEPVFYSDNYYWRQDAGVWYRSHDYRRGWDRAEAPVAVRGISRPQAYVHYHATGSARADVRDHRTDTRPSYPTPAPALGPEVRDHRDDNRVEDNRREDNRGDRHDGFQPQPQPQPVQPVQPQPQRPQPRPEAMPQRDVRQDDRREQKQDQRDQKKDEREQRKDDKKRDR